MRYAIDYYYTDGKREFPLAVFLFDGRRITYEIRFRGNEISSPPFDPGKLSEHLESIIQLPLVRSELRARTMPNIFGKLRRNTMDHFRGIRHNSTYFKFSPIRTVGGAYDNTMVSRSSVA